MSARTVPAMLSSQAAPCDCSRNTKAQNCTPAEKLPRGRVLALFASLFQPFLRRLFCLLSDRPWTERLSACAAGSAANEGARHSPGKSTRKDRQTAARNASVTRILAGKASEVSCSCALTRPSSAIARSTITSSATTGRASLKPVEKIVEPSRTITSPAPADKVYDPGGLILQAAGEDADHLAMQSRGEEQQSGDRLRQAPRRCRNRPAYSGRPWRRRSSRTGGRPSGRRGRTPRRGIPPPGRCSGPRQLPTISHPTSRPIAGSRGRHRPEREHSDRES